MILVLGHSGAGKSTLLRRFSSATTALPPRAVRPTNGTELVPVQWGASRRNQTVCRELGGVLFPLWFSYLTPEVAAVIYVLDASDSSQVSRAAVSLVELLSERRLFPRRVLVLLNKSSSRSFQQLGQLVTVLRLEELRRTFPGRLDCFSCDAASGENTERVLGWISELKHSKSN